MTTLLLVHLEEGLHPSRQVGIFHAVVQIPGVVSVQDITLLTQERLDELLMKPEPVAPKRRRKKAAAA